MDEKEISAKILDEIAITEKQITEYKEIIKPVAPDNAIGRLSRMDAIINNKVAEYSLRRSEERLNKLKYALSKVGTSNFGICVECGAAIPPARILMIPESRHCVNCAK